MAARDKKLYDQRILCQKRGNESSENVLLVAINMFMIIKSLSRIDIVFVLVLGLTGARRFTVNAVLFCSSLI